MWSDLADWMLRWSSLTCVAFRPEEGVNKICATCRHLHMERLRDSRWRHAKKKKMECWHPAVTTDRHIIIPTLRWTLHVACLVFFPVCSQRVSIDPLLKRKVTSHLPREQPSAKLQSPLWHSCHGDPSRTASEQRSNLSVEDENA